MNLHQWFCGGKEPCACMPSWKAMTDAEREQIAREAMGDKFVPSPNRERSEIVTERAGGSAGGLFADGFFVEKRKHPRFGTIPEQTDKPVIHVGDFSRFNNNSHENVLRAMTADQAMKLAELLVEHAKEILES